jgi:zeaxanthin glucosyltransferase
MARIGVFCLPWIGHVNPFSALARKLALRGHEIVFFTAPDFAEQVRQRGFAVEVYGGGMCPEGTFGEAVVAQSSLDGMEAIRANLDILKLQAEALFAEAPSLIEKAGLELWIVDQLDYAASTLAAKMRASFVTVIVTLMRNAESGVPGFSGEPYSDDPATRERDQRYNEELLKSTEAFRDFIGAYRRSAGMGGFSYESIWSDLAQITQQPAEFEFPRQGLPGCFHFTGPFVHPAARPETPFPWHRLSEKPLVYVSFGTVQNLHLHLVETVAEALAGMDVQVVISAGGSDWSEFKRRLPGDPIVVSYAPQLEILDKATLMVTHAGMNSTLECLSAGVPMVAIPIAYDQAGVSARIEWTGTGVRIPARECETVRLRKAVETVLSQESYRNSARRFQRIIAAADGPSRAADIIERVAELRSPVLRDWA